MRSNEKKYRRSFRNIDRQSSLAWEARSPAPMMPLSLFRDSDFAGANGLSGALFLLPFMLIQVHGCSATTAGAAFLPFSAIMGLGIALGGRLGRALRLATAAPARTIGNGDRLWDPRSFWRRSAPDDKSSALTDAYRLVMFTAAGLAAMSAITTGLMISSGRN